NPRPADLTAQRLRDRAMEMLAAATVHAERLGAAAEKLGLTPDLLDGVGDQLYDAAVAQLDLASKVLERAQSIADRLLDLGEKRFETRTLTRVDVKAGEPAALRFVVENVSALSAKVVVTVDGAWEVDEPIGRKIGQETLPGRRQTSVEISISADHIKKRAVYAGTVHVSLEYDSRKVQLADREFEIWVEGR
ncbi:MAG TPA: hypothetical protein VGD80_38285, partial [Kofleriaceae bacterium]